MVCPIGTRKGSFNAPEKRKDGGADHGAIRTNQHMLRAAATKQCTDKSLTCWTDNHHRCSLEFFISTQRFKVIQGII